jgi:prepilin-type N-terminal cleavage/methylation domain-containing protein
MKGGTYMVNNKANAFTIVELLIVIVVIGILAAITIVGYSMVIGQANDKGVQSDISEMADIIKTKNLDTQTVPAGGITSAGVGTSTTLTGISFRPVPKVYDLTVANLYYCEGYINGTDEFGIVARAAKSKNAFSYMSTRGISSFAANVWTTAVNGNAVCTALGFTAPYTWSYGFNPTGSVWSSWATP